MPGRRAWSSPGRAATHRRGVQLLVVTILNHWRRAPCARARAQARLPRSRGPHSGRRRVGILGGARTPPLARDLAGAGRSLLVAGRYHPCNFALSNRAANGRSSLRSQVTVDSPQSGPRHVVNGPLTVRRHQEITHYGDPGSTLRREGCVMKGSSRCCWSQPCSRVAARASLNAAPWNRPISPS